MATGLGLWSHGEYRIKGLCNRPQGLRKAAEASCVAEGSLHGGPEGPPQGTVKVKPGLTCRGLGWVCLICRGELQTGRGNHPGSVLQGKSYQNPLAMGHRVTDWSLLFPPHAIFLPCGMVMYILCTVFSKYVVGFFDFTVSYNEEIALSLRRHLGLETVLRLKGYGDF